MQWARQNLSQYDIEFPIVGTGLAGGGVGLAVGVGGWTTEMLSWYHLVSLGVVSGIQKKKPVGGEGGLEIHLYQ